MKNEEWEVTKAPGGHQNPPEHPPPGG